MEDATNPSIREELPRQAEWVGRLARRLVHDAAAAEDVAQEALLAGMHGAPGDRPAGAWLARVTRNLARRAHRAAEARARHERAAARPDLVPATDEVLARLEVQRQLVEELGALPPELRDTLVRRFLDGWSAARIARACGVPASTVRWRVQRGLSELRARLERRAGGDGASWRLALLPLVRPSLEIPFPGDATPAALGVLQGALTMKLSTWAVALGTLSVAVGLGALWRAGHAGAPRTDPAAAPPAAAEPAPLARSAGPAAGEIRPGDPEESAREALVGRPAPSAAAAQPTRVAGRCLDLDLVPVAGAHVLELDAPERQPARTDGDGAFVLECAPAAERGERLLRVEARGLATRFLRVSATDGATTYLGDVLLAPGGAVHGRVVDAAGRPFPGALVTVGAAGVPGDLASARRTGPTVGAEGLGTRAAGDGGFRIEGVEAGMVRVWASAEGMLHAVSEPLPVPARGEGDALELVLEPLARPDLVAGVVLDPEGRPVAGAGISFLRRHGLSSESGNARTDAQGGFALHGAQDASYDLFVHDPEDRWAPLRRAKVPAGTSGLELRFGPARWVELVVTAQGEPVETFALSAPAADDSPATGAREEPHPGGLSRLRAPSEPFLVRVDAPGFRLAEEGPFDPAAPPARLSFELEPEPGVRGRVVAYGEPVRGARVQLYATHPGARIEHQGYPSLVDPHPLRETTSDDEGRFVLSVRESGSLVVRAEAPGLAPGDLGPLAVEPRTGVAGLELVLSRGGALEGRVLMPPGRDAAGVIVALNRGDGHPRTVRSGADGSFRFAGLTPGPWHLSRGEVEVREGRGATAFSGGGRAVIPFDCEVRDGETSVRDLDLRGWEPCRVEGELAVNGAPGAGWIVEGWPGAAHAVTGEVPSTATDDAGRFVLEVAAPGPVRLVLEPPSAEGRVELELELDLEPGTNPWRADLALGRLEGTWSGEPPADGEDTATALLYVSGDGVEPRCQALLAPAPDGTFVLPFVPAGPGELRRLVRSDDALVWTTLATLDVPAGGTRTVRLP